jgi:hypothetical protein
MDIEVLKRQGAMITNELAKTWFAQQIEIIEQRI